MPLPILTIRNLSKAFGPQTLFENVSLCICENERIGLIGKNGCGKSTFLQILAKLQSCDDGCIEYHKGTSVGYLPQNPAFLPEDTPQSIVESALHEQLERIAVYETISHQLATSKDRAEIEKLIHQQEEQQALIEQHGGWNTQHRVKGILQQLSIPEDQLQTPVLNMSGGQQRRVALARVLLMQPDLLLLDEPTNHLDMETTEWLENLLRNYPSALLITTHDRAFLNAITTRIVEIHKAEWLSFPGDYTHFVEQKAALLEQREREQQRAANLLVTELDWLRRAPKARGTKSKSRIERVYEIQEKAKVTHELELNIAFQTDKHLGNIILEARNISKSFGDHNVFKPFDLAVRKEDKIAIIGSNGCGKSTLLNILTKKIQPDTGDVITGKNTSPAFLSQHRDGLNPDDTIYTAISDGDFVRVQGQNVHKRGFLQQFLFRPEEQDKKIASLSGGERCRLLFAKMMCSNANLLILDEPTNDLDIQSLQTLEDAILHYNGCVLFVTHDRFFINRVATAVLAFDDQKKIFIRYDGDYDFYKVCKEKEIPDKMPESRPTEVKQRQNTPQQPKVRKLTFKEMHELEAMEETVMNAELQKEELEATLNDPELYKTQPQRVAELTRQLNELSDNINQLYDRWNLLTQIQQGMITN